VSSLDGLNARISDRGFGMKATVHTPGEIAVGDHVTVTGWR
jgi:hypothetical protein